MVKYDKKKTPYQIIWEKKNGEVPKGKLLHHINGDRNLNVIKNLRLVSHNEHSKIHHAWRKAFGKRPKEKVINYKDGNFKNNSKENLELLDYPDYFKKNYPKLKNLHKRRKN